jgi:hypothetical membrane protein
MSRRALLVCGVLSPLLYAFADGLSGLRWEDYRFRDFTISELGAIGSPSRFLFTTLLIPTYLLLLGFGIGVWRSADGRRRVRVVGGVLAGLAVLALGVGLFVPMRPRGTEQGTAGMLHVVEGTLWMLGLLTAMGFCATAFERRFRLYTVATIGVVLIFLAWTGVQGPRIEAGLPTPGLGIIERIWWYAYQLWFAVLAVKILREPPAEGMGSLPEAAGDG